MYILCYLFSLIQWDLVCKRSALRPLTQTSISLGKASGAILAGLMSDRYGRRLPYMCGAVLFVAVSVVMSVTPWYWPFMAGRLGAGLASGLMFYPAVILGESETFDDYFIC